MPTILGEEVCAADMNGRLLCIDAISGNRLWETDKVTGDKSPHSKTYFDPVN